MMNRVCIPTLEHGNENIKKNEQLFASKYQRILPTEEELIAETEREKRLIEGVE